MIDATVNIIDRLIQLFTLREQNREKYFTNFVEPMYRDAEAVFGDYVGLFRELISRLHRNDDAPDVIRWLEERRLELLPIRIKLRSFLAVDFKRRKEFESSMDKFQKGIWGLMKGGVSLIEEGHVEMEEYGWGDHTVLDLLYAWSQSPPHLHRARYIESANEQLSCLEKAWADVTLGYAEIKRKMV